MKLGKQYTWSFVIVSACYLALGALLLFYPAMRMSMLCYSLGGITVLYGVIHLVLYFARRDFEDLYRLDFVTGTVMAAVGVYVIANPAFSERYLPMLVGLAICLDSLIKLQNAIDLYRLHSRIWWTVLLLAVITGALGITLVFREQYTFFSQLQVLGASLLLDGCVNIWSLVFLSLNLKRLRKDRLTAEQVAQTVTAEDDVPDAPQPEILRPTPQELGPACEMAKPEESGTAMRAAEAENESKPTESETENEH